MYIQTIKVFVPKPLDQRIRNREYDERRGSARKRGYTHQWDKAAAAFKREHPLCRMCEQQGRVTPAFAVDHIIPHKGDMTLFWDRSNWQPLCREHHDIDKQRIERGGRARQQVGPDGWPI